MKKTNKTKELAHFGEHLMIDGYGGDRKLLDSKKVVEKCLNDLPKKMGMHMLAKPVVYHAPANDVKDPGGWSGFVVIAESHISVHTFPRRQFVSIDAYTCQSDLDTGAVQHFFKQAFALKDMEVNFVRRGTRYPADNLV